MSVFSYLANLTSKYVLVTHNNETSHRQLILMIYLMGKNILDGFLKALRDEIIKEFL